VTNDRFNLVIVPLMVWVSHFPRHGTEAVRAALADRPGREHESDGYLRGDEAARRSITQGFESRAAMKRVPSKTYGRAHPNAATHLPKYGPVSIRYDHADETPIVVDRAQRLELRDRTCPNPD
jgi:hypothetical protein